MENRKELSEKSKKLIAIQFKSDILNKSTGYYKKEKIFPITSKPNELRIKFKKFIPHFNEITPAERKFNNLLSDKQRNNSLIINNKKFEPNKNEELEIKRKRAKTIRDNCYDEKGNFSCKKRFFFEFYGINNINIEKYDNSEFNVDNNSLNDIKNAKENEEKKEKNDINDDNIDINYKKIKRKIIRKLLLKSRNENNFKNDNDIKPNYEKFNTVNEDKGISLIFNKLNRKNKNNLFLNNIKERHLKKISRNKPQINYNDLYLSTFTNREIQNTTSNIIIPNNIYNRIQTDITLNNTFSYNPREIPKNKIKDISRVFYTKKNYPIKNIKIKQDMKNKDEKKYHNLEFKIKNNKPNTELSPSNKINKKNIKEIFNKNGLHTYNLNEDNMNILSNDKKIKEKLRKNKEDINFKKYYKNIYEFMDNKRIELDKNKILDEKGFQNKVVKRKRKGTPGKVLYDNRFHKDENTKINTGKKNKNLQNKKSKNILPQNNIDYKNHFKFKEKFFNHNKL